MEQSANVTFGLEESLNGVQYNGKAEGKQENTIIECAEQLCTLPTIGQTWFPLGLCR
jgi:hypothetical protein